MNGKYLLLGSNLGDRIHVLRYAREAINRRVGKVIRSSSIYETAAWGYEDQPDFLNQVVEVDTVLSPEEVLSEILSIEKDLGRVRFERWHERSIDIDILFFDDQIIDSKHLRIPHSEIPNRRFTLEPLRELCGSDVHPVLKKSINELANDCGDALKVKKIKEPVD